MSSNDTFHRILRGDDTNGTQSSIGSTQEVPGTIPSSQSSAGSSGSTQEVPGTSLSSHSSPTLTNPTQDTAPTVVSPSLVDTSNKSSNKSTASSQLGNTSAGSSAQAHYYAKPASPRRSPLTVDAQHLANHSHYDEECTTIHPNNFTTPSSVVRSPPSNIKVPDKKSTPSSAISQLSSPGMANFDIHDKLSFDE